MQENFYCSETAPLVQTKQGPVRGYHAKGLDIFKGVPYGTAKRFHAPQPMDAWPPPLDATNYGNVCPLLSVDVPKGELKVPHRYWVQDENCLNLNVWTPACDTGKRPVMVWLHGGGYSAGSAIEQVAYEGENMALLGDCVVVSVNHRLNILGYFDLSDFGAQYENSGNAGGDDIVLALQWVRHNVAAFGGDPDNVTVFGQSGGGGKVITLLQTPAADGLFHKGIIMSGVLGPQFVDCKGSGKECAEAVMAQLGVATVAELETVPYAQLAAAYNKVSPALRKQGKNVGCVPYANAFYLGDPLYGEHGFRPQTAHVPLMVGTVLGEFWGFGSAAHTPSVEAVCGAETAAQLTALFEAAYPGRSAADVLRVDTVFRAPTIQYIAARAAAGGAAYSYLFQQDFPIDGRTMAWHCADIPFVFHNAELVPVCAFPGAQALENIVFNAVMRFARTGEPGWQASKKTQENTMLFGAQCRVVTNHDHALIAALQPLGGQIAAQLAKGDAQIQH